MIIKKNIFKTNNKLKYINSSLLRKTIYYKKTLCINRNKTDIKIYKIKTIKDFQNLLTYKKNWNEKEIYWLINKNKFSTFFLKTNVDIIACSANKKIVCLYTNIQPNKIINFSNNVQSFWICQIGGIDYWKLKVSDELSTNY